MYKKKTFVFIILALTLSLTANDLLQQGIDALHQKKESIARSSLQKVLVENPHNIHALYYLAITEFYANNSSAAAGYLDKLLSDAPNNDQIAQTAATIYNHIGQFDKAQQLFEELYDKNPRNENCITKLLPIYLRSMDWYYAEKLCRVHDLWWYNEDISDQTVLLDLSSEWNGLGDVFQIIRYAKHLHDAGAQVTVRVRKELIPLLAGCSYIAQLIPNETAKPITDKTYALTTDRCFLRMKNLMYEPSNDIPYIFADQKRINRWEPFFRNNSKLNVGICFQSTKMRDYFTDAITPGPRAFAADLLKPLLGVKNITFYSLQKGEDEAVQALKNAGFHLITFGSFDTDGAFTDTAAIMKNLDLVITVDTSIAHLAGALGVPVWVMLPYSADFRWLRDRSDSPLYPTMRLLRQPSPGDWQSVIAKIVQLLQL